MTIEERNIIKTKIQDEIAELSVIHPFLIIECSTGFGKSWALIKSIYKSKTKNKWLICVPEIAQIANFRKEIELCNLDINDKIEDVICYASLKNYEKTKLNIAINECQHLSLPRLEIIKTIDYEQVIADSATISQEILFRLSEIGNFHTYSLPLKEGIDLGIFHAPRIHLVPVSINSIKDKFEYKKFAKVVKGTAEQYYEHLSDQVKYWRQRYNREHENYMENKSLQYASIRKRFMASLKTIKAKELSNKFTEENRRFIAFCGSIPQAEELGGKKYTIHSKKSKKANKEIIESFNSLNTNKLYSIGMATEGMNLTDLDTVMIVQLDSGEMTNSLKSIQMMGRLRNGGDIYLLYLPGLQDQIYLNNTINVIGKEYLVKN